MNPFRYQNDHDDHEIYTCHLDDETPTDRRGGDILTCVKQRRREKKAKIINLFA
jgi:hypothetical protein